MRRILTCALTLGVMALLACVLPQAVAADGPSADRVVAMYFHRTQRCPTCIKMGNYSEEAIKVGFAQQIKDGRVEFHSIDFQNQKNASLTKGYKINGPALIVARIAGNKVAEYKNLTEIWSKVGDKAAFIQYVQAGVKDIQK